MNYATNVTRLLDSRRIPYRVHLYAYGEGLHSATEVADAIGLPAASVFKTLSLAKAAGVKKAKMAAHDDAEKLTGLLTGGISALALTNKGFVVLLDASALQDATIVVSAGERGAQIELAPADFIKLTRARTAKLAG